jgi:hypothetical protein
MHVRYSSTVDPIPGSDPNPNPNRLSSRPRFLRFGYAPLSTPPLSRSPRTLPPPSPPLPPSLPLSPLLLPSLHPSARIPQPTPSLPSRSHLCTLCVCTPCASKSSPRRLCTTAPLHTTLAPPHLARGSSPTHPTCVTANLWRSTSGVQSPPVPTPILTPSPTPRVSPPPPPPPPPHTAAAATRQR